MRYNNVFPFIAAAYVITTVTWTSGLAIELSDNSLDRKLQVDDGEPSSVQLYLAALADLGPNTGDDTCAHVHDDIDSLELSSVTMEKEGGVESNGFLGNIFDRITTGFDSGNLFGRLMNGLLNFFRLFRQRNETRFKIPTDTIVPVLSSYSMKIRSLAQLLRNEGVTFAADSDPPDAIRAIFDLSADNMESVASVIDPIVNDMSQYEAMDINTVACSMGHLLAHVRDDTLPNIISIAEIIYTNSGNEEMENRYTEYSAATTVPSNSLYQAASTGEDNSNQCSDEFNNGSTLATKMESDTSVQARVGSVGDYFVRIGELIFRIIAFVILFPISIIASIGALITAIFFVFYTIIFQDIPSFLPCDGTGIGSFFSILVILGLIASPIIIPLLIIGTIFQLVRFLISPILPIPTFSPVTLFPTFPPVTPFPSILVAAPDATPVTRPVPTPVQTPDMIPIDSPVANPTIGTSNFEEQSKDVMDRLLIVLESPLEGMIDTMQRLYYGEANDDEELELDYEIKTMSCHSNALLAALPF